MVLLWVLFIYHLKDDSGINHKLLYNTRSDRKLCSLYLVKNKPSFETTFFKIKSHYYYLAFWLVNEAKYLAWNCGLKTRLSDIFSHLRKHNNYPQIESVFKTIFTLWRAKNNRKRFSKWARGSSLFWNELKILREA